MLFRSIERERHSHLPAVDAALELAESADAAHEVDTLVGAEIGDAEDVAKYEIA